MAVQLDYWLASYEYFSLFNGSEGMPLDCCHVVVVVVLCSRHASKKKEGEREC